MGKRKVLTQMLTQLLAELTDNMGRSKAQCPGECKVGIKAVSGRDPGRQEKVAVPGRGWKKRGQLLSGFILEGAIAPTTSHVISRTHSQPVESTGQTTLQVRRLRP